MHYEVPPNTERLSNQPLIIKLEPTEVPLDPREPYLSIKKLSEFLQIPDNALFRGLHRPTKEAMKEIINAILELGIDYVSDIGVPLTPGFQTAQIFTQQELNPHRMIRLAATKNPQISPPDLEGYGIILIYDNHDNGISLNPDTEHHYTADDFRRYLIAIVIIDFNNSTYTTNFTK